MENPIREAHEEIEHLEELPESRLKVIITVLILLVTAATTVAGVLAANWSGNESTAQRNRQESSAQAVSAGVGATLRTAADQQQRDDATEYGWRATLLRYRAAAAYGSTASTLDAEAAVAGRQQAAVQAALPRAHRPYPSYDAQLTVPVQVSQQTAQAYAEQSEGWLGKESSALSIISMLALALFLLGLALTIAHRPTQVGFAALALVMLIVSVVRLGVTATSPVASPTAACIGDYGTAQAQMYGGDFSAAARTLGRVVDACPDYADAWSRLGDAHSDIDTPADIRAAATDYTRALGLQPAKPANLYNNLGYTQLLEGEDVLAAQNLQRAIALDPGNDVTLASLAELHMVDGDMSGADGYLARALRLVAQHGPAYRDQFFESFRIDEQNFTGRTIPQARLDRFYTTVKEAEASLDALHSIKPGDAHGATVTDLRVTPVTTSAGIAGTATLGFDYTGFRAGDVLSVRWYEYGDVYELADSAPSARVDRASAGSGAVGGGNYDVPVAAGQHTVEIYLNGVLLASTTFTMPGHSS